MGACGHGAVDTPHMAAGECSDTSMGRAPVATVGPCSLKPQVKGQRMTQVRSEALPPPPLAPRFALRPALAPCCTLPSPHPRAHADGCTRLSLNESLPRDLPWCTPHGRRCRLRGWRDWAGAHDEGRGHIGKRASWRSRLAHAGPTLAGCYAQPPPPHRGTVLLRRSPACIHRAGARGCQAIPALQLPPCKKMTNLRMPSCSGKVQRHHLQHRLPSPASTLCPATPQAHLPAAAATAAAPYTQPSGA